MNDILFNNNTFRFIINHFDSGYHSDMTNGKNANYIAYIINGNARIVSGTSEISVNKGELFYIPANLKYHSYWYGEKTVDFYSFSFRFFPNNGNQYPLQIIPTTNKMLDMLHDIPCIDTKRDTDIPPHITCTAVWKFYRFLDVVMENMSFAYNTSKEISIHKAINYMQTNDIYDVPTLAAYCNMSKVAFHCAFKEITGMTPIEKKHELQTLKAEVLLSSTNMSIDEIAQHVGFESTNYFRKIFKRRYNKTPHEFRKQI